MTALQQALVGGAIVLAAGAGVLGGSYLAQSPAPPTPVHTVGTVPDAGQIPVAPLSPSPGARPATSPALGTVLAASTPVSLTVPAIGVRTSPVQPLGLNSNGTIQVPPLTQAGVREAGWYRLGPAPGSLGPAIIVGHVDSYQGPGIFYHLGELKPGEPIDVTLADHAVARFRVQAVASYPKARFPTQQVYGHLRYAGLRLITCGGKFDPATHSYLSNIVVYAALVH